MLRRPASPLPDGRINGDEGIVRTGSKGSEYSVPSPPPSQAPGSRDSGAFYLPSCFLPCHKIVPQNNGLKMIYRKVKLLDLSDAAYIAGLIDGEGTVTLTRRNRYKNRG